MKKIAWLVAGGLVAVLLIGLRTLRHQSDPADVSTETTIRPTPANSVIPERHNAFLITGADPIADGLVGHGLNTSVGNTKQDLDTIQTVFRAWQRRGSGSGNPSGTNREITAALTGRNIWKLVFIPPDHPAINSRGELCDRWGIPLFFHQLSGTEMELRSDGADRQRFTTDDIVSR